jgi:hypothetical protein
MIGFGDCPQKSKVLGHRRSEAERLSTSLNRAVSLVKKIGPKRSVAVTFGYEEETPRASIKGVQYIRGRPGDFGRRPTGEDIY